MPEPVSRTGMYQKGAHGVIRNGEDPAYRTGLVRGQFWLLANKLRAAGRAGQDYGISRWAGPNHKNRCTPSVEQAFLAYLTRIRSGRAQRDLEIEFGIYQSSISRYLDDTEKILAEIVPAARNVTAEMKNMKSTRKITVLIPGLDGTIIVDGTRSRI